MSISALTTLALVARRSSRPTASRSSLARSRKRFLAVKAGALAVDIYPSAAAKFSSDKDKAKYEHLNIDFQGGIPKDSKGVFAEFAGVQAMSEATNALLKKPQAL